MAFIALATLAISCLVLKLRVKPSGRRQIFQLHAYREPAFLINQIAGFVAFVGFFAPFFYLESYSLAQPQDDKSIAFYLLPMILAGSFCGRIVPNFFADKTGPFLVLIPGCFISGLLALCWIAIKSTRGLIAFAVLFGFFTGGIVSITPLTVVAITPNYRDLGTRMGMFMGGGALATLIGAPILGAILNDTGSYLGVQIFCGVLLIAGGVLWIPTYWFATRAHDRKVAVGEFSVGGAGGPQMSKEIRVSDNEK
ncbi:putative mfs monocarboxylate transporter [Phaeomoniella chlamydospora]|uniref:Putative mfs monocarboxylate transporter n=1 Tax=Phaeomoniella chlamydospora TaxID=158046 RepID=A0A0G2GXA9_PHACM|nr:putative mfs monocarboxylate transporter [Phaeomoniella chlamydospora]